MPIDPDSQEPDNIMEKNQKKKIVILLAHLEPIGNIRSMVNIANALANNGVKTSIVVLKKGGLLIDQISNKADIISLDSDNLPLAAVRLARYVNKARPTAILSIPGKFGVLLPISKVFWKVPVTIAFRKATIDRVSDETTWKGKALTYAKYRLLKNANKIITTSFMMKNEMINVLNIPEEKLAVIRATIDVDRILARANEEVSHPWFNEDTPIILGCGGLEYRKGYDLLIKAFARLKKEGVAARLVIIGEGSKRQEYEQLIKELDIEDSVCLLGHKDNPCKYMYRASVFAMPSRKEGIPNALLEAMACGLPVVASDCPGGMGEILADDKRGRIFATGCIISLFNELDKTLKMDRILDISERMIFFNPEKIKQQYSNFLL